MSLRLMFVSVPVKDQQKAKAFYRDILGFSIETEAPMGEGQTWISMKPPNGKAGITLVTWFDKLTPGGQQGLVLGTKDIDAAHAELKAKGLKIKPVSNAPWGRFATFTDPDGNGWVLTAPAAAKPARAETKARPRKKK